MKRIIMPVMILGALYMPLFAETLEEEAARRMPPVLSALDMPEIVVSDQPVTVKWSILGYHDSYKANMAFFECSSTSNCGGNYSSNFDNSGNLAPISSRGGGWTYNGLESTLFNYEYTFTPKYVDDATKIVMRIYRLNSTDEEAGKSGLSLLMPGDISDTYYDTSGRRVVKYIIPTLTDTEQLFTETEVLTRDDGTSDNDFTYPGQCVWYAFERLIELNDEGFFEATEWTKIYDSIHGKTGRHAKEWVKNWMLGKKYEISNIPEIGSLVVWTPNEDNTDNNLYEYGHIAFVEKVDTVGKTFTVTQFNVSGNELYSRSTYSYGNSGSKLYAARYNEAEFIKLKYKIPTNPDAWDPTRF